MDAVVYYVTVLLTFQVISSSGSNILFVTLVPSPSHHGLHKTLALELVERGHNVTILTYETEKEELPKNLTVITMKGIYEFLEREFEVQKFIEMKEMDTIKGWSNYLLTSAKFCYKTEGFRTLWNYPKNYQFDLIIYDSSQGRFMYVFTERFHNPPSIGLVPFLLPPTVLYSYGGFPYPAYDPHYTCEFTDEMTTIQRAYNAFYTYFEILYIKFVHQPAEETIVAECYPKVNSSLEDLEDKVGLILANSNHVLDYHKMLPPNIIQVGGLQAKPARPLPRDLQKIMNASAAGVVLFSLGTNLRSADLKPDTLKALLNAFAKLPHTVLWKFEANLSDVPKNVVIRKWLPQNDILVRDGVTAQRLMRSKSIGKKLILGHPNTKLFISHGGALSTHEAVYHGVPLIVIPFYADQKINALKITSRMAGLKLNWRDLSEKVLDGALKEVLYNAKYSENMKFLSTKFRDQPLSALQTAVFWVEYAIRHGNLNHLSPPTRKMPLYKVLYLDVLGICLFVIVFVLFLIIFFIRKCLVLLVRQKTKVE